ncbi:MAG: hypothetical protein ACHQ50_10360 [Fimbriimonadales bacterium]
MGRIAGERGETVRQMQINIAGAQISYNHLYENMPIDWREEDLLFVRLPNGNVIDVGWYPACDPKGRFKITLSDPAQNQIDSIRMLDLDQVVGAVEGLASDPAQNPARETSVSIEYNAHRSSLDSVHTESCTTAVSPREVSQPPTQNVVA